MEFTIRFAIIIITFVAELFAISNYPENNLGCVYPCQCPQLPSYIHTPCDKPTVDRCGCCLICRRQLGERCNHDSLLCDSANGLGCQFKSPADLWGICTKLGGKQCIVDIGTYNHGESFKLDCRTQCICINGTYACASLCPQELIEPKGSCQNPRLIEVPNQCCRQWMCDSQLSQVPNCTGGGVEKWSECSRNCGVGKSYRKVTYFDENRLECRTKLESRFCQIRDCQHFKKQTTKIRKRHKCKPTLRLSNLIHYHWSDNNYECESVKTYPIKYCNDCTNRRLDCRPIRSKTIIVDVRCNHKQPNEVNVHYSSLWSEFRTVTDHVSGTNSSLVQSTILSMAVLNFPDNYTKEESMLQEKYQKLKRKKKAVQALRNPKPQPKIPVKIKKTVEAKEAREVVKKLMKSGAIAPIKKTNDRGGEKVFKRPVGLEKKLTDNKIHGYTPFSAVQNDFENDPISMTKSVSETSKVRDSNLYDSFLATRHREERGLMDVKEKIDKPRQGNTIYVSGSKISEEFLKKHFGHVGNIVNVSLEVEKNHGFVTFDKVECTEKATAEFDGKVVGGITLKVSLARRQPQIQPINDVTSSSAWSTIAATEPQKGGHNSARDFVVYENLFD